MNIHASCVEWEGKGILILGKSNSGKSDLALRLIDIGAQLVADDQVDLALSNDGTIAASCPDKIRGRLEIRGFGIARLPSLLETKLFFAAELVDRGCVERLPFKASFDYGGVRIPLMKMNAFDVSAVAKLKMAIRQTQLQQERRQRRKIKEKEQEAKGKGS